MRAGQLGIYLVMGLPPNPIAIALQLETQIFSIFRYGLKQAQTNFE